jgi:hypothetical protein
MPRLASVKLFFQRIQPQHGEGKIAGGGANVSHLMAIGHHLRAGGGLGACERHRNFPQAALLAAA